MVDSAGAAIDDSLVGERDILRRALIVLFPPGGFLLACGVKRTLLIGLREASGSLICYDATCLRPSFEKYSGEGG